jgi:hypothetical protein
MRFEYYHSGLDDVPKLSVDGTVDNSIHFSHWNGNKTPAELKADTSTEIALNLVASEKRDQLTRGIDLVTNNHFDTDGVLSVWTVLTGERALNLRDKLIPAAESGDFSAYTNEGAIRASIVIQGSDQPSLEDKPGSPIACHLANRTVGEDEAYDYVLPEVENILTKIDDYEPLWRTAWDRIAVAVDSFERGQSTAVNDESGLSLVSLGPEVFAPDGFNPARHSAPFTAISRYARGQLFLITTPLRNGWSYRVDYPYYSWAETVVRPRIPRRDFSEVLARLNEHEGDEAGRWQPDASELSSAVKFVDGNGRLAASRLQPDDVARIVRQVLTSDAGAREAVVG